MVLTDMVAFLSRLRKALEKEGYNKEMIDPIIRLARRAWKEAESILEEG